MPVSREAHFRSREAGVLTSMIEIFRVLELHRFIHISRGSLSLLSRENTNYSHKLRKIILFNKDIAANDIESLSVLYKIYIIILKLIVNKIFIIKKIIPFWFNKLKHLSL